MTVINFPHSVQIFPVLPEQIDNVLSDVIPLLKLAHKRVERNMPIDAIIDDLRSGGSVMWLVYVGDKLSAAITTAIVRHPLRDNLKIEFIGGMDMKVWVKKALNLLVEIAKDANCAAIEADGRKGFEKIAVGLDFKPIYTHYEMELT